MRYEKQINDLVELELDYAKAKHGDEFLNSHHEKYAVILEKWEGVKEEISDFPREMACYWHYSKQDNIGKTNAFLSAMRVNAMRAIDKLIQVVAMIDKPVE